MIFVTIGSMFPFDRLIRVMDAWALANPGQQVLAQIGDGTYEPKHTKFVRRLSQSDFGATVAGAELIVSHAGMGTVITAGRAGILHGNRTYLLQDENGQIIETHSISAGLDYPGVGPEHAWLKDSGRAQYVTITDDEALQAFHDCCHLEGIIPALESSHALAYAAKLAPTLANDKVLLVNLSGRGDKDMHTVAEKSGMVF